MLFSVSTLRDETGIAAGIVCVARDISERKKLKEEIFKSKKLESLGILAGGIAHDFNNLFTIVVGNLTMARDEISPGEKAHKLLLKAEQASLKAADLARRFITFSPQGWLKKEKINLSSILKNARESENLMSQNVIYDIDISADLMPICGDEAQLTQVIQNLFLNAAGAIEALADRVAGKISVRAENAPVEDVKDQIDSNILLKKEKYVKVLIEDNGIGISPGNMEKVFDPYFTTRDKTDQKGMGLGLTLCYSIIKKHGGHITLESEKAKGTTVTLYLPVYMD